MTKQEAIYLFAQKIPNRIPVKVAPSGPGWYIFSENTLNNGKPLAGVADACFYKVTETGVEFVSMMHLPEKLSFQRIG